MVEGEQGTEMTIAVRTRNRMLELGRPDRLYELKLGKGRVTVCACRSVQHGRIDRNHDSRASL